MATQAIVNRAAASQVAVSSRTRLLGYAGGSPGMIMDQKKSGLDCNPIEGGRLLLFFPGKDGYIGGYDKWKGQYQKAYVDLMPSDYRFHVDRMFHTQTDFGYRNLDMLTDLPYEIRRDDYVDAAAEYFSVVHPFIGHCPFGLNQKVQMADPEVGEGELVYVHCPSCRLADLKSKDCIARIETAAAGGLDRNILISLRSMLIEANEATIRFADSSIRKVQGEITKRMAGAANGRTALNTVDRIHLKQMHKEENKQTDTGLQMIKEFGASVAEALLAKQTTPATPPVDVPQNTSVAAASSATIDEAEFRDFQKWKAKVAAAEKMRAAKDAKKKAT